MKIRLFISINKVVWTLIRADFFFFSALGLIGPVFAVFLTDHIQDGSLEVAGFAAAIYWILKSIIELPIGRHLDKHKGEKDDLYFLIIGYFIVACVSFGYIFASLSWHIYILEAIYAVGMAMAMPGWSAIFTRHIDKGREGAEWSVEHVAYSIGTGVMGALGGILVTKFGFDTIFFISGVIALVGAFFPLLISRDVAGRGDHHFRFQKIKDQ